MQDRDSTCCLVLYQLTSVQLPRASPHGVLLLLDCLVAPARIPSVSAYDAGRAREQ